MKKVLYYAISFICITLILSGCVLSFFTRMDSLKTLMIEHVDISQLSDGVYTGIYKNPEVSDIINYELKITVKDKKITDIVAVKKETDTRNAVPTLIKNVLSLQKNDIDVVTGATVTSKLFMKALENGLKSKPQ